MTPASSTTAQASGSDPLLSPPEALGSCPTVAIVISGAGLLVAQLLVRNLDEAVKEALRRRARWHGRSMEEEARLILCQATQSGAWSPSESSPGLGSRMATLFAGLGLEEPITPWQGQSAEPADFSA